jgi:hypothetical protein
MNRIFHSVSTLICVSMILSFPPKSPSIGLAENLPRESETQPVSLEMARASAAFSHLSSPLPRSRVVTGTIPSLTEASTAGLTDH